MKRILAIVLTLVLVLGVCAGCAGGKDDVIKIGFICLHDENSTYDLNFINAVEEAKTNLGLTDDQIIIKTNIPEGSECYDAAADLVDQGCDIVFANSFGHETFMIQAAKEFPDVQFCHATGTKAHTEGLDNYHNAFASIYEGRYLAGVAAGLKLNEMIEAGKFTAEEAKMGYVGAFTYAEVISGYTSFYLGAKSVCPTVTMDVQFTGSWYEPTFEKEAAELLISKGAKLVSQHADSMGAPSTCEKAGVPNVSYNGSTQEACPNTFIVSSRINWAPYYEYIYNCVKNGEEIAADWTGTIATNSVLLTDVNEAVAAKDTVAKLEAVKAELIAGTRKVFDTATFTIENGKKLDTYKFEENTEVVENGAFNESKFQSAPYFDLAIDGITRLNEEFGD